MKGKIPDRIWYYILQWKDENPMEFKVQSPKPRLRDLDGGEFLELFYYATGRDSKKIPR